VLAYFAELYFLEMFIIFFNYPSKAEEFTRMFACNTRCEKKNYLSFHQFCYVSQTTVVILLISQDDATDTTSCGSCRNGVIDHTEMHPSACIRNSCWWSVRWLLPLLGDEYWRVRKWLKKIHLPDARRPSHLSPYNQ